MEKDLSLICPWLKLSSVSRLGRSTRSLARMESINNTQFTILEENLSDVFKAIKKLPGRSSKAEPAAFEKKNKFLQAFEADFKFCEDFDKNEYIIILCHSVKVLKASALFLIDQQGLILGVSSPTGSLLKVQPEEVLTFIYKRIGSIFSRRLINHKELFKKQGSGKIKPLTVSGDLFWKHLLIAGVTASTKHYLEDEKSIKSGSKTQTKRLSIEKTADFSKLLGVEVNDLEYKISASRPYNCSKSITMIEIKYQLRHGGEEEEEKEGMTNNSYSVTPTRSVMKTYKRGRIFYFYLNPKFQYGGSFERRYAKPSSNLDVSEIDPKSQPYLNKNTLLLYELKTSHLRKQEESGEEKIDYGAGIRVKRLTKEGVILDYHEEMDMDSSFEDSFKADNQNESQINLFQERSRQRNNSKVTKKDQDVLTKSSKNKSKKSPASKKKRILEDYDSDDEDSEMKRSNINFIRNMKNKDELIRLLESKKMVKSLRFLICLNIF